MFGIMFCTSSFQITNRLKNVQYMFVFSSKASFFTVTLDEFEPKFWKGSQTISNGYLSKVLNITLAALFSFLSLLVAILDG